MVDTKRLLSLIKTGEGISVEFKECKNSAPKSLYESICSFLNRAGGDILLGISDDKTILGIDEDSIDNIKQEIVTTINNPQKINPPVYLKIEDVEIKGKNILYVSVPESSQVHKCCNKIFDRNEDGDLNITDNNSLLTSMYLRKEKTFTENIVYPYCKMSDLREDLIEKARKMAINQNYNHPWKQLSDIELLKSVKLYTKDYQTGKSGFTLACILLFGKDETISSILPFHKTDLILRKQNLDRYDDRDDVRTNLIESYDRIMNFGVKHLSDPFYLEGTQRISVRAKIMREIASNILIHREYTNPFPAKIIIEKNRIFAENGNKPHGCGKIDLKNFSPFPKNPVIARVFKEIGFADELGSGVRNLIKYAKIYSDSVPELIEGDVFKIIIPLKEETPQTTPQTHLTELESKILELIKKDNSISRKDISEKLDIGEDTIKEYLIRLKKKGVLAREGTYKGVWIVHG